MVRTIVPGNADDRPEKDLGSPNAHHYAKSPSADHDLSLSFDFRDPTPTPGQNLSSLRLGRLKAENAMFPGGPWPWPGRDSARNSALEYLNGIHDALGRQGKPGREDEKIKAKVGEKREN